MSGPMQRVFTVIHRSRVLLCSMKSSENRCILLILGLNPRAIS
jgi:hypothetical protein